MTLDTYQQVASLAMAASKLTLYVGNEKSLQCTFEKHLPKALKAIGDWTLSWGPRVWKLHSDAMLGGPDNTWFATTGHLKFPDGQTYPTCVVAIGATALWSKEDWENEDFDVKHVVDFEQWTSQWPSSGEIPFPTDTCAAKIQPKTPYIARGTAKGVYQLMTQKAPEGTVAAGKTLGEHIASLQGVKKLIFTGHSLGGALSPTLALCMAKAHNANILRNFDISDVLTYPLAGASPGEENFAKQFQETFPPIPTYPTSGEYQVWNYDLYNALDIVPQAWCQQAGQPRDLLNIPGIYGNHPAKWSLQGRVYESVMGKVQKEVHNANASGVVYRPINGQSFKEGKTPAIPQLFSGFLLHALRQHIRAYVDHLKLNLPKASELDPVEGVRVKTLKERARDFPVLRYLQDELVKEGQDQTPAPF
ncbi:hypothetical protein FRC03_002344 [Tulasnella sp. 419]|nr:hypothetical protein FRC03_002344 [Tulasnella sp. 419]